MGVKLEDLLKETGSTEVKVGNSTIHLGHLMIWDARITPEDRKRFENMEPRLYYKEILPRILTNWDITNGSGETIPITAESIDEHSLPNSLLASFVAAVVDSSISGKVRGSS